MAKAISFARAKVPALPLGEMVRAAVVSGCGFALILAGPAFPL